MTPSLNHNQFARGGSPSSRCSSKAARPHPSLCPCRAATTFDHQKTTHRGHGACRNRDGASRRDALFPADRQGRVHSFAAGSVMAFSSTMTLFHPVTGGGFGPRIFPALSHIDGIGRRANAILASLIQHRRQGRFQRIAKGHESHSRISVLYAPNLARGGHDEIHEHSTSGEAHDC